MLPAFGIQPKIETLMELFDQLNSPLKRSDLQPPPTLTQQFNRIRNILAGEASGSTLDIKLVEQLIDLLLCKFYDERIRSDDEIVAFQKAPNDATADVWERLKTLFAEVREQPRVQSVFDSEMALGVEPKLAIRIVQILQRFEVTAAGRDVIGEAFETFMGSSLRGAKGQFFTPRNVARLTCQVLNPKSGETVVDPACGTGGFLTEAERLSSSNGNSVTALGIDKDQFLARIAAVQLALLAPETSSWAYSGDSLRPLDEKSDSLQRQIQPGTADVVVTNPPFGKKISIDPDVLADYDLGYNWKRTKDSDPMLWRKSNKIAPGTSPQVVFIERCLQLLRPGGRMGIVLPDGILGNVRTGYIRQFITDKAHVVAVIDLPLETFLPSTSTKTSILFLRKKNRDADQKKIFMAVAKNCGHDRRGKPVYADDGSLKDDFPAIADSFADWKEDHASDF